METFSALQAICAGDLRRFRAHYDVTVMKNGSQIPLTPQLTSGLVETISTHEL